MSIGKSLRTTAEDDEITARIETFLEAIDKVCAEHGFSISHEDGHGAFEILNYNGSSGIEGADDCYMTPGQEEAEKLAEAVRAQEIRVARYESARSHRPEVLRDLILKIQKIETK